MENSRLSPTLIEELRSFSTCALANAIEELGVRLLNEGFTNDSVKSFTPDLSPALGYAVTVKIRCSSPPAIGPSYVERTQWWDYILSLPQPRFVIIQDIDPFPGTGALVGQVHSAILQALGCVGVATNGAVRDIHEVAAMGFHLFARTLSVSHAYSHIVEMGIPVQLGGLVVQHGDLIHGDCHGLLSIPKDRASELPALVAKMMEREEQLFALCRAPDFSIEALREAIRRFRTQPL
jgi:4-hydroxy-4-methyl-2-oxoglutarate aldolase